MFCICFNMKNIFFSYLLVFFIEYVTCNVDLLAKFHQNSYKLKDIRTEVVSYDKNYVELLNFQTFKYNRTTTAHNITVRTKKDLYDKTEVIVQGYKLLSNEYRHFPIRFQVNLKKAYEANVAGVLQMKNCGNITNFNFLKDITYYTCNYVVDANFLPPFVPNGQYKFECQLLFLNLPIGKVNVFEEIYTPMDYPKN